MTASMRSFLPTVCEQNLECSDRRWRMTSLSVNKVLQSEERWLSSESSYCGFDSRSRQCEGPFFCSSESGIVPGSPSCAQYALRSLRTLKWGPMSTFRWIFTNKLLRMSFWQMSFWRMMHNSSRIIQMMTVAAPNGRMEERTDFVKLQQVAQQARPVFLSHDWAPVPE